MADAETILTSAGVAGFVTLVIEYAAKPRLEVRKERIIERARARSRIEGQLLRALAHGDTVLYLDSLEQMSCGSASSEVRQERKALRDRAFDSMGTAGAELHDSAVLLERALLPEVASFLAHVGGLLQGMAVTRDLVPEFQRGGPVHGAARAVRPLLTRSRWRTWLGARRRDQMATIKRFNRQLSDDITQYVAPEQRW